MRYTAASDPADRADAREEMDVEERDPLLLPRTEVLDLGPGQSVQGAIEELEADPAVMAAEPNYVMELHSTPNDGFFGELWGLHNTGQPIRGTAGTADADIDAPEAWDRSTGFGKVYLEGNVRRVLKPDATLWVTGPRHIIFSIGFALQ